MSQILIVEDHENLRVSLQSCLEAEALFVKAVSSLAEARLSLKLEAPDLILLDWMLPDGQGIDLLKELRRDGKQLPVIFLTARAETVDKVLGLELGASDYVTKPFEPRELIARVRARLREAVATSPTPTASDILRIGSLSIDRSKHQVCFRTVSIELVKKEFDLLVLFAENPEKVFSRDEILNKVWGYDVFPTTRTVDMHVMLLRQKIDNDLIETVRSVGYKFKPL